MFAWRYPSTPEPNTRARTAPSPSPTGESETNFRTTSGSEMQRKTRMAVTVTSPGKTYLMNLFASSIRPFHGWIPIAPGYWSISSGVSPDKRDLLQQCERVSYRRLGRPFRLGETSEYSRAMQSDPFHAWSPGRAAQKPLDLIANCKLIKHLPGMCPGRRYRSKRKPVGRSCVTNL